MQRCEPELNNLVRHFNLSKNQTELHYFQFYGWNLLTQWTKVSVFRKSAGDFINFWNKNDTSFFSKMLSSYLFPLNINMHSKLSQPICAESFFHSLFYQHSSWQSNKHAQVCLTLLFTLHVLQPVLNACPGMPGIHKTVYSVGNI